MRAGTLAVAIVLATLLAACSSAPPRDAASRAESRPPARASGGAPARPLPTNPRGGYYGDDGPPVEVPPGLESTPDAVPRAEPLSPRANRPYVVFGRSYLPMTQLAPYRERGAASWYGRKFHGQATSSGEPYDMFGMSAAHPTLPLPSFARVTNLRNGRSVIVRVNDRGPFLNDRLIDLSYAAALKLGYAQGGSTEVEVESIVPGAQQPGVEPPMSIQIVQASMEGALPAVPPDPPRPSLPIQDSPRPLQQAQPRPPVPAPPSSSPAADEPLRLTVETLPGPAAGAPVGSDARPLALSQREPLPASDAAMSMQPAPPTQQASATRAAASTAPATPARADWRPVPAASLDRSARAATRAASSDQGARAFVQMGAFASRGNADAARLRLADGLDLRGAALDLVEERGLFKLLAGPLSATEAAALAERIGQATGSRPFVVTR